MKSKLRSFWHKMFLKENYFEGNTIYFLVLVAILKIFWKTFLCQKCFFTQKHFQKNNFIFLVFGCIIENAAKKHV